MKKRLFCLLMVLTLAWAVVCSAAAESAGTWVCENCKTTNTGSFCEECGAAKPGWVCICGSHNEKKYCPVCGTSYENLQQIYNEAVAAFNSGDYQGAGARFDYLKGFNDSQTYLEQCVAKLVTPTPAQQSGGTINFDDPGYDPASEEGGQTEQIVVVQTPAPVTPAPTAASEYAGATPVPIFPVDRPTPTPVPKMEFKDSDYTTYEAKELHLTFEGPAGWILEGPTGWNSESDAEDTYILTNPDMRLDYAAQIRIRVVPVNKQYTTKELAKEVVATRDALRSELGLTKFDKYDTAGYNFLKVKNNKGKYEFIKNKGVYTRYKGVLQETGAKVAGRIIANCHDKVLYILSASYPGGDLQETFENVYRKVRDTVHLTD